jgi:hypothetical protein
MLLKKYKLKEGKAHTQDGVPLQAGDTVMLTQTQAVAFRDKFDPVDNSEFQEQEYEPFTKSSQSEDKRALPSDKAPQGQPVQTPPVHVPPKGGAATGPADPSTLDPAKQGQQTTEQRAIIDAGKAPLPASAVAGTPPAAEPANPPAGATKEHTGSGKTSDSSKR